MQITLTMNVTNEQLAAFLTSNKTGITIKKGTTTNSEDKRTVSSAPTTRTPLATLENPSQYLRTPGTPTGVQGHPFKLNDSGLKLVYKYAKQGYTPAEISNAFGGVVGATAIRRFVTNVKSSK